MHAIRFDHVTKQYNRRHSRSFREWFIGLGPTPKYRQNLIEDDHFLALDDVSFEIQPGESVGLIGHNGAGKSTTLKLVGRLISPSHGRVSVNGRVAALLELGAGFHPELSGRDNVFLSGALLGLSRRDMQQRFDPIVAFAELDSFIDMPVKHYSSGMFARLAFAVSAHIEPDILLVDEALAVGDYNFQQKCLARIDELKSRGVTIVLVSHAHDTIREHCRRVLWFDHGQLIADGAGESEIARYIDWTVGKDLEQRAADAATAAEARRWGSGEVEITDVRATRPDGEVPAYFETGEPVHIRLAYRLTADVPPPVFGIAIHRQDGLHITGPNTGFDRFEVPEGSRAGSVTYRIDHLPLLDGVYQISVAAHHRDDIPMYDYHDRLYTFRVDNRSGRVRERYGLMSMMGSWTLRPDPQEGQGASAADSASTATPSAS